MSRSLLSIEMKEEPPKKKAHAQRRGHEKFHVKFKKLLVVFCCLKVEYLWVEKVVFQDDS